MMTQKDEYLARGSRCSSRFVGYSHARYPIRGLSDLVQWLRVTGLTEIEHAAKPLVVVTGQIDVFFDSHHARVRQGGF